ncbi:MAG: ribonuclease J [bacterium]
MNQNPNNPTGGHHGEFQAKSAHPPKNSTYRPNDRAHQNNRTFVYRKDTSLESIEQALNKIALPPVKSPEGTTAPATRSDKRGSFHAKRMNNRGDRRKPRGFDQPRIRDDRPGSSRKNDIIPPLKKGDVRVVVIGGVEKIGAVNMTVVEYMDEIVVIDAGFQFTDDDTPGIDFMIPNTKYLEDRKHMIKGLAITHGHLDHIGSLSFVMEALGNPPIYTMEFGAMLIKKRHEEYPHLPELNIKIVDKGDGAIPLSEHLKIRFFGITHSIPDSAGVIVETPFGDVVSTGDVRVENDNGIPTEEEVQQYKFFKDREVLLMTLDSTGIDKPGWTISEKVVADTVDKIIRDTKGRLLIATFASQVERIIAFLESAKRYGRVVVIEGRAMKTNMAIVKHLNLTNFDHIVDVEDMHKYPQNKIMMLVTGGQGEQYSILDRVSKGTHKYLKLEKSDTIVFSSSVIPGNEGTVDALKDALYKKDPKIITYQDSEVHASGHGKRGELEWVHKQINYKYFMPVHGNYARLMMHRDLVENLGIKREQVIIPDGNGTIIEFSNGGNTMNVLAAKAPHETIAVEGTRIGELQEVVIRDRKLLLESGVFNIFAVIDEKTGKLKKSPDIFSRGFVYIRENQELFHKVRGLVKKVIEDRTVDPNYSIDDLKEELIEKIERFLLQKTGKKPIVMAAIVTF